MPELSYQTKIAATFKKIERTIIGADGIAASGYITVRKDGDMLAITLNTAKLPHGELAGPGLEVLKTQLEKQFGKDAALLERTGKDNGEADLGIPPAYRLSFAVSDDHDALTALLRVHRDMVMYHCQAMLRGQMEEQLDYLTEQLGAKQAAIAFEAMTGAVMRYREQPRAGVRTAFP